MTSILARSYDTLVGMVPEDLLPKIDHVQARRSTITAKMTEYGCGAYGCVLATHNPDVVLKVTTDDTEAEFAAELANSLVRPICVRYPHVIGLDEKYKGDLVYLLWRDAAQHVGELPEILGDTALRLVDEQHAAAQHAYGILERVTQSKGGITDEGTERVRDSLGQWLATCEAMARQTQVPALRALGDGLAQVYTKQHILFGDIHTGNLGLVRDAWVITDPGHVAVVNPDTF